MVLGYMGAWGVHEGLVGKGVHGCVLGCLSAGGRVDACVGSFVDRERTLLRCTARLMEWDEYDGGLMLVPFAPPHPPHPYPLQWDHWGMCGSGKSQRRIPGRWSRGHGSHRQLHHRVRAAVRRHADDRCVAGWTASGLRLRRQLSLLGSECTLSVERRHTHTITRTLFFVHACTHQM